MFDFIQIQFRLGRIDKNQVMAFAPRFITAAQAKEIVDAERGELLT